MPPQTPPEDQFVDPAFPVLGIDLSRPFAIQRDGTTFVGDNVRAFEPGTGRGRGGSRPGLSRFISQQVPAGAELLQLLTVVVRADGIALLANYDDAAPDLYDPSSIGPPDSWPPGRFTRTPALPIPQGGWGIPPWKGAPVTPNIVWPDPAAIAIGTALSGTQLNAVARDRQSNDVVPGSYTYYPISGTELPLGLAQELFVTFTPTDTTRYRIRTATAHIDVLQDEPTDIEFVQYVYGAIGDGPLTVIATLPGDTATGNLLVAMTYGDAITSITDSQLNLWTKKVERAGPNPLIGSTSIWYAIAGNSAPLTISFNFDDPGFIPDVAVLEFRGIDPTTPSDGSSSNDGELPTGGTVTTGSISVSAADGLAVAFFITDADVSAALGGFTELQLGGFSIVYLIGVSASLAATATVPALTGAYMATGASFFKDN